MRRAGAVFGDHRQGEPRAQDEPRFADAVEEAQVLREAAERDVLAVVRRRLRVALALRQRLHGAAQRRPRLEQRHLRARVDEVERGREPGEAASDDRRPHRSSPRATTASFAGVERRHDAPKTSKPFSSIRSSCPR